MALKSAANGLRRVGRTIIREFSTKPMTSLDCSGQGRMLSGRPWLRGGMRAGFGRDGRQVYGERPALLAQLEVTCTSGKTVRVVTDGTWRGIRGTSHSRRPPGWRSYDARRETPDGHPRVLTTRYGHRPRLIRGSRRYAGRSETPAGARSYE